MVEIFFINALVKMYKQYIRQKSLSNNFQSVRVFLPELKDDNKGEPVAVDWIAGRSHKKTVTWQPWCLGTGLLRHRTVPGPVMEAMYQEDTRRKGVETIFG